MHDPPATLFFGAPQLAFLGSLLLHLNHVKSTSQCYCDLNPFSLTHSGTTFKNPLGSQKRKWDCKKLSKGLERWLTSLKNSPAVAVDTGFVPNIHMVALINRSFTILWQYIPLCLFACLFVLNTGFFCIAMAVLKLTLWTKLASNSWKSTTSVPES